MLKRTLNQNMVDAHIGRRIRVRRLWLGMAQARLAETLGLSVQQVHKYEQGANRILASRLQQIADALEVPVSHFFEDAAMRDATAADANSRHQAELEQILAIEEGPALIRAFSRIQDQKIRVRILSLVKVLAIPSEQPAPPLPYRHPPSTTIKPMVRSVVYRTASTPLAK